MEERGKLVTWPVKPYIDDISVNYKVLIKGWMVTLSEALGNNVVFLSPNNNAGHPNWGKKLKYVELFSNGKNINKGDFSGKFALMKPKSPCDKIRENTERFIKCLSQDESVVREVYCYYYDKAKMLQRDCPRLEPFNTEVEEIDAFRYECEYTHLTEWAVPVFINANHSVSTRNGRRIIKKLPHLIGVLITGQFIEDVNDKELIEDLKIKGVLTKQLRKTPSVDESRFKNFFKAVKSLCVALEKLYDNRTSSETIKLMMLSEYLLDDLPNYQDPSQPFTYDSFQSLNQHLCSGLYKAVYALREEAKFTSIDVFKPDIKANINEDANRINAFRIREGASADYEKRESDKNNPLLAKQAKFIMKNWKDARNISSVDVLTTTEYPLNEELDRQGNGLFCDGYYEPPVNQIEDGCSYAVLVSKSPRQSGVPLVFIIRDDMQRVCSRNIIEKVLKNIMTTYWMRWNQINVEYLQFLNSLMIRYNNHEIKQIIAGGRALNDTIGPEISRLLDNSSNIEKQALKTLRKFKDYTEERNHFDNQLTLVVNLTSDAFSKAPDMKHFLPFDDVLFMLHSIYRRIAASEGQGAKSLLCPIVTYDDKTRPRIYADRDRFFQICGNLLRNAVKYSHWHSKIIMDCFLTKSKRNGKTVYRFEVINYGNPEFIPLSNEKDIFDMGVRSERAEKVEQTGIGFGLYLARYFARQMGGEADFEEPVFISDYHVPLLNQYHYFADYLTPEECSKYQKELDNLKATGLYDEVMREERFSNLRDAELCVYEYFDAHIGEPTAKICFYIELPHVRYYKTI